MKSRSSTSTVLDWAARLSCSAVTKIFELLGLELQWVWRCSSSKFLGFHAEFNIPDGLAPPQLGNLTDLHYLSLGGGSQNYPDILHGLYVWGPQLDFSYLLCKTYLWLKLTFTGKFIPLNISMLSLLVRLWNW